MSIVGLAVFFVSFVGCDRTPRVANPPGPRANLPGPRANPPAAAECRTWTGSAEGFPVEAAYRGYSSTNRNGVESTTVTLQRKDDGKILTVSMADLSKPDQDFIKAKQEEVQARHSSTEMESRAAEKQAEWEKKWGEELEELDKPRKELEEKWEAEAKKREEEEKVEETRWNEFQAEMEKQRIERDERAAERDAEREKMWAERDTAKRNFQTADKTGLRTWTNSSGSSTIEASLESFDGNMVKLKKTDGKVLSLALGKLSSADKRYLTKDAPAGAIERPAPITLDTSPSKATTKTVNIKNVKATGKRGDTRWSCPPDPSPAVKLPSRIFTFHTGEAPIHSSPVDYEFFFSRNGRKVLYAFQMKYSFITNDEKEDDSTKIFLGDVASEETTVMITPLRLTSYGLSPDGSKAMFLQTPWEQGIHWGQKGKIHIMKCTSNQLEPFIILNPIENPEQRSGQKNADVEKAIWASNDHVLIYYTAGGQNLLVLVDINTGRAVWRLRPDSMVEKTLTLSPNARYFLIKAEKAVHLIETASGKTVGTLEGIGKFENEKYSFSPNGRKIASCGDTMIRIWDATTGKPEEAFVVGGAYSSSSVNFSWVGDQYLMVDGELIDITLPAPVWVYAGFIDNISYFGGQFWYMTGTLRGSSRTLVGVKLPHKKALDQFSDNKNDHDRFIVQPGMTVTLKMDSSISRDQEEIRRSVEEKLRNNGLTLASNAPVTFLLKVTQGEEKTTVYADGPSRRTGHTEVKYRSQRYHILVQQDTETLWERVYETKAPMVMNSTGATVQEQITQEMQEMHYKDWFLQQNFPKNIPRTDNLGRSHLEEQGVQDY